MHVHARTLQEACTRGRYIEVMIHTHGQNMSDHNDEQEMLQETAVGSELSDETECEGTKSSSGALATCSGPQLSENGPKKRQRYSCTFHFESNQFAWAVVS